MADYLRDTHRRKEIPDKSALMVAYTRMRLDFSDEQQDDLASKKSSLIELATIATTQLHKAIESSVEIREGSIIAEIIIVGNLHELLSIENLKLLKFVIEENNIDLIAKTGMRLLTSCKLREILLVLVKDIKGTTAALSRHVRWIFGAKLLDMERSETRTGVVGYLQRGLDALDVARAPTNTYEKKANAMKRATRSFSSIEKATGNIDDRKLLCTYLDRELERINLIKAKGKITEKEREFIDEYNYNYDCIQNIKRILCEL